VGLLWLECQTYERDEVVKHLLKCVCSFERMKLGSRESCRRVNEGESSLGVHEIERWEEHQTAFDCRKSRDSK